MKKRLALVLAAVLSLGSAPLASPDWDAVASQAAWSIVALLTPTGDVYCTGFVIDTERDLVLTADHCVEAANRYGVPLIVDGAPAEEIYHNPSRDLALLKTPTEKPGLEPGYPAQAGQPVLGMGFGEGFPLKAIRSTVTDPNCNPAEFITGQWVCIAPAWLAGMSGGPVLDEHGQVVSMVQDYVPDENGEDLVDFGNSVTDLLQFIADSGVYAPAPVAN